MPETHDLKCWPAPFKAMFEGRKLFEFRRDDRGFSEGDTLRLLEWDPEYLTDQQHGRYTGRSMQVLVTYVLRGPQFGIPEGFCVMSVSGFRWIPRELDDDPTL